MCAILISKCKINVLDGIINDRLCGNNLNEYRKKNKLINHVGGTKNMGKTKKRIVRIWESSLYMEHTFSLFEPLVHWVQFIVLTK